MTRKKCISGLTALFIGTILSLTAMVQAGQDTGRKEMVLEGGKSGPVPFGHHLHQTVVGDCQVCHKDFPQQEGALEQAKAQGKLKKKQVMNKTCVKCHRGKKKAGESHGPVSCKTCHRK